MFRSQRLLDRQRSALVVIDMQISLVPLVIEYRRTVINASRLIRGAKLLDVPVQATEQYPKGLKGTVDELAELLPKPHEKTDFSIAAVGELVEQLTAAERSQVVLCGIETHICVLQSAMDLLAEGFDVSIVTDAVSARGAEDHAVALQRLRDEGVQLVTTEGVLFEWCRTSQDDAFKGISGIVKEGEKGKGSIGFRAGLE